MTLPAQRISDLEREIKELRQALLVNRQDLNGLTLRVVGAEQALEVRDHALESVKKEFADYKSATEGSIAALGLSVSNLLETTTCLFDMIKKES